MGFSRRKKHAVCGEITARSNNWKRSGGGKVRASARSSTRSLLASDGARKDGMSVVGVAALTADGVYRWSVSPFRGCFTLLGAGDAEEAEGVWRKNERPVCWPPGALRLMGRDDDEEEEVASRADAASTSPFAASNVSRAVESSNDGWSESSSASDISVSLFDESDCGGE